MSILSLAAVFFIFVCVSATSWSAKSAHPDFAQRAVAATIGTQIFTVTSKTHRYDVTSGVWITLASHPNYKMRQVAVAVPIGKIYVVGGGETQYAGTTANHAYTPHLDAWETKTQYPIAQSGVAGDVESYGSRIWMLGGRLPGAQKMFRYDVHLDTWTSRTSAPSLVLDSGSAGFYLRSLYYLGCNTERMHIYNLPTDTWTSGASIPTPRLSLYDQGAMHGKSFYAVGKYPAGSVVVEMYAIESDSWTSVTPLPSSCNFCSSAVAASSLFVFLQNDPVYAYALPYFADFQGDPHVTAFDGQQALLHLRPGLFNLLATKDVVVNAVIETLPSLPAEENTVMTMLGVVAQTSEQLTQFDCFVGTEQPGGGFHCSIQDWKRDESPMANDFVVDFGPNFAVISLPSAVIQVTYNNVHVAAVRGDRAPEGDDSQWMDVSVSLDHTTPLHRVHGLFAGLADLGLIDNYEVEDGCIFSVSSLSVFESQHPGLAAVMC